MMNDVPDVVERIKYDEGDVLLPNELEEWRSTRW